MPVPEKTALDRRRFLALGGAVLGGTGLATGFTIAAPTSDWAESLGVAGVAVLLQASAAVELA